MRNRKLSSIKMFTMLLLSRTFRRSIMMGVAGAVAVLCYSPPSEASTIVFQGKNAGLFPTANPNAVGILMNSVPKKNATEKPKTTTGINTATMIQSAVASQISNRIYQDIFNGTAQTGYYDLGDGNSINYARSEGYITITITNPSNGSTTITVPDAAS
jgi:hypothetical protein